MSAKRISQQTFDDVVNECIEEFELSPQDALADAITQFTKQGIDLSGIDISGGIGREEIIASISDLCQSISTYLQFKEEPLISLKLRDDALASISAFRSVWDGQPSFRLRNQSLAIANGAINAIHSLIAPNVDAALLISALDELSNLSKSNGNDCFFD